MKTKIVGISGLAGSGKDLFFDSLSKKINAKRFALADELKSEVRIPFLNSGVYQMPISASSLPSSPFITQGSKSFYALGVDPASGVIYVADAIDYVQKSSVYRYTSQGVLLNTFKAGIITGDFVW